jgi:hypothetical protein
MSLTVQAGRALPFSMNLPVFLLTAAIVVIGLWPSLIFGLTQGAGQALLSVINGQ